MLTQIELRHFKCFELLRLPLADLTLLSGFNASGKSSILQALVLLHQTMHDQEWSTRLMLNGSAAKLGTVADVVDKVHGRRNFEIGIQDDEMRYHWVFGGDRSEMSLAVESVAAGVLLIKNPELLRYLLPYELGDRTPTIADRLKGLTYITAERVGPREVYALDDRQISSVVGPDGENAVSLLQWGRDEEVLQDLALSDAPATRLRQVEARMRVFFPGCAISVQQIPQANSVTLGIRTSVDTDFHRPIHVGFGLTQVLPIVVAAVSAKRGDILLIENPEVHLHPVGQSLMGQFLCDVAKAGIQIIVETHSDHVLSGIRRSVRETRLEPGRVAVHFFQMRSEETSQVLSPRLDNSGNVDVWPPGFFDQFDKDSNYFTDGDSDLELLVNDLSIEGQFADVASFRDAVARLMRIRQVAGRFGRTLCCHRSIASARVTASMSMPQAVQELSVDQRRSFMLWLTRQGPFWEDARIHSQDVWLEHGGNTVVTNTAIGEAAWCQLWSIDRRLVSFIPSRWQFTPIPVRWIEGSTVTLLEVLNYWDPTAIEIELSKAPLPISSWRELEKVVKVRFANLTFLPDCFGPLSGLPFVSAVAHRVVFILETLDHFRVCFDESGKRTPEGQRLYQNFFTGKKGDGGRGALFSDSSDDEKRIFRREITFRDPKVSGGAFLCSWHAKIQTPQFRVHFSWPVTAVAPLYVAYVGPKITKR